MSYKRPRATSPSGAQKRPRGAGATPSTITLGTELPPDEDGDDGTFVPVWKQTVTDERGRRRLHGAFTGGFSAGYFNTVGSKEGWTPKTFVSSRANRNKDTTQRAEDFMDDEDKAAAAESRELETAQSFATIGRVGDSQNDALFGLFVTEEETMGVKIAQKMGWRRDQGVGRKVRRSARSDDTAGATAHAFAPKDSRMISAAREEVNRKGLGYQSEARLGVTEEKEPEDRPMLALPWLEGPSKTKASEKAAPKKSSFGVGVLNDTGSDDEDPYELGPKIKFNKSLGKDKKPKKPSKFAKAGVERIVFKPKKTPGEASARPQLSYDGKPPLSGFVLATQIIDLTSKKRYPPPKIPPGWRSSKSTTKPADAKSHQSVSDAAKSSTLDAKARASLLGETLLPGKSVFDFIPKEVRDRLATMTGKVHLPQGRGEGAPEGYQDPNSTKPKDLWTFVPILDKGTAAAALAKGATGWMPYAEDANKRARYVGFLEIRAGLKTELPERAEKTSVSDWAKELQEFAHAAEVFKPTSGLMASRFTSSTSTSLPGSGTATPNENLLRQPATKPQDPAEQAAKLGMYGPMTRSTFPFHPSRLLCKRFNIKAPPDMPPADADADGASFGGRTEEAVSKSAMDKMVHEVLSKGAPALQRPAWMGATPEETLEAPSTPAVPLEGAHATVDVEKNDALTQERAPEDVFKAIFGDDDDDDE
ncbi:G patch domain-containing protein 1 [Karstenula rhodostoma CBS 690.94]|uniref:G patch domain-containing protein 1 n=1 Tax=Karstenula rhodostoma CBS 690.94 TaxID=1392251 RepID=A0A9P4PP41_9PLEO|nr:G patch domain-containing protein 1 [Karstenula rhodostoma CBS 690.94]